MMNGIIVDYTLDPKYFEVGASYQIHIGTNNFKTALLAKYSKDEVTFKYLEKGDIIDLTVTISELMYRNDYWLTKMKPDYENGKFSCD